MIHTTQLPTLTDGDKERFQTMTFLCRRFCVSSSNSEPGSFSLTDMQSLIETMYGTKDEARGVSGTFMWLMEEVGELAASLREEEGRDGPASDELASEFADVLAWLATIANVANVDLQAAFLRKYSAGCPGCGDMVCSCTGDKP